MLETEKFLFFVYCDAILERVRLQKSIFRSGVRQSGR